MYSENIIAVIGDIHGCLFTLKSLYDKLIRETENIYSVGDLIDRGKHSKKVVQFCSLQNIIPVRGNHEEMLINAIETLKPDSDFQYSYPVSSYFQNGGGKTQESYIDTPLIDDFPKFASVFKQTEDYEYLKSFPLKIEFDKVVITHAGIVKGAAVNDDVLWNRRDPSDIGKLQIFGHTPVTDINIKEGIFAGIDTGCVYGEGRTLSAVIVDTNTGEILNTYSEKKDEYD